MITRTPGTCGGRARVAGTRYTVALLEQWRLHPLTVADLREARGYANRHRDEIEADIEEEAEHG